MWEVVMAGPQTSVVLPQHVGRFEGNLYPRDRRKGEKCLGDVIERLARAGCPEGNVKAWLMAYTLGVNEHKHLERKHTYEETHLMVRLLLAKIKSLKVQADLLRFKGRAASAEDTEQEIKEAEREIERIEDADVHSFWRYGAAGLDWLIVLQEAAKYVGSPLTEGELAGLVWAAVSAVYPKARTIETDSLARSLARFRKRNTDFVKVVQGRIPELLAL
jgi:hypothetical protein